MKTLFLLSTLFPAGLLAAWVGSNAATQEETPAAATRGNRQIRVVRTTAPPVNVQSGVAGLTVTTPSVVTWAQEAAAPMAPAHGVVSGPWLAQPPRNFAFEVNVARAGDSDRLHKAIEKLHSAKSDDDKDSARTELKDALAEQFDEYLEQQSKELDRMEEKLSKLRKQWEKRRDAKGELVTLRLQMLENEANGLGWPGGGDSENFLWSSNVLPFASSEPSLYTIPPVPAVTATIEENEEMEMDDDEDDSGDSEPKAAPAPRPRRHAR